MNPEERRHTHESALEAAAIFLMFAVLFGILAYHLLT